MKRREFLKSAAAVSAVASRPALGAAGSGQPCQAVVILGESVRRDMLNCYRNTGLLTPNLDRLAAEGMRFEQAYNCQPVCAPSRSALWTGLYPHTNGVWGQRLRDRSIQTALIGKWHLDGFDYFGTGKAPSGWDAEYWYDMRDYLMELSPADRVRSRNPKTGADPSSRADMCFGHRATSRAIDLLKKHRDKDFLLCICYDEPHGPCLCPKEYADKYESHQFPPSANLEDSLRDKPAEQRIWAGKRLNEKPGPIYRQTILRIPHVYRRGNRAVVFTSDHGVFLGSHRLQDKGPAMYDEITRVPFIVRWPGHSPAGSVNSNLVSHIDLAGTLMEVFGFDLPPTIEGGSMLSAFLSTAKPVREDAFIEWGRYR